MRKPFGVAPGWLFSRLKKLELDKEILADTTDITPELDQ
jgi:hypothetical protein